MVSRKVLGASIVLVAVVLAGCAAKTPAASSPTASLDKPFTIYASLGVSGPLAGPAAANIAGLDAAAAAVNAEGGIDGRKVTVVVKDDGLDPAKATTLLQEQLDAGPIDLVVAGSVSNVGLALLPTLTRQGIISTGQQGALNDGSKYPNEFGTVVPNLTLVQSLVNAVVKDGHKKIAFLHANDANGQSINAAVTAAASAAGLTVVDQSFAPTDVDMTAQLQALQAEKPDALIVQGFGAVAGYTLQSRTKLGWDIPTYGFVDYGSVDLSKISSPADWKNVKILTFYALDPTVQHTEGYSMLKKALAAKNVKIDQPLSQYAVFWDMVFLARKAWDNSKSDNINDLKAAWLGLNEKATANSPYVYMPYYKFQASTHQYDIKPNDATRLVSPGPIVDGLITSAK